MTETDNQNLQKQLDQAHEETSSLHHQIKLLKTMIDSSQKEGPQDVVTLKKKLHDSQKHSEQLERVITFLRSKSEGALAESKQLEGDFSASQETLHSLQLQLQESQSETEEFAKKFNRSQVEIEELQEELKAVSAQFGELKNQILASRKDGEGTKKAFEESAKTIQELQNALQQQTLSFKGVEEELASIKTTLQQGIVQAQEIEKQYLEAIDQKVSFGNEAEMLLIQNNQLQEEVRHLKDQISDTHMREQEMQAETGQQVDLLIRQRDQANNRARESSESVKRLLAENEGLKKVNKDLENRSTNAEAQKSEFEYEIKTAHQHLAKKVKETSVLSEQIEELKLRTLELQKAHESDKTRTQELENRLSQEMHTGKRLEEKLQELREQADQQTNKWEEKYFGLCERLQDAEARNKELQGLEERHNQMQALLASLGTFMTKRQLPPESESPMQIVDTQNLRPKKPTEKLPDLFDL